MSIAVSVNKWNADAAPRSAIQSLNDQGRLRGDTE